MKKEDLISLLVYVLMIVIAVVVGLCVIRPIFGYVSIGNNGAANIGMALLIVIGAILVNVILIELGHILGAKISGYKIMSVNIIGICFYRYENKWKIKFANFDGLTGETKIAPKRDTASPRYFALMPLFIYVIEVVILAVTQFTLSSFITPQKIDNLNLVVILCIIFITVGGMLELYNIFPAHLDSTTDGYRLTLLSKKENVSAFNELMRIESAYMENKELNDMKVFEQITDFTSSVNLYTVYKCLKEKKYDEASVILDNIIAHRDNISKDTYCSALAQKMFIVLLTKEYNVAKEYYDTHITQEERRYISNDLSMQSIRAYLLISSMLDISEHEARYAIGRVNKALKRTSPGRAMIEKELYQEALNKVDAVRPEWHIKEKEIK